MKAVVTSLNGSAGEEIELPPQFDAGYRPDLIRRAFHASRSLSLQPKGVLPGAGMRNTARYFGRRHRSRSTIGTGRSRLPREKIPGGWLGRVMRVPQAVGGHRAHPPKPWKKIVEKINFKEKNKAICSAISATANVELVRKRGHNFEGKLPVVVDNSLESVNRVKNAVKALEKLGLAEDLKRARKGRRIRSGRARLRKGGYKAPSSVLIVFGEDHGIWRATRNLPGVEAVKASELGVELLAPGGDAGRLTVWTQNAIELLNKEQFYLV